MATPCGISSNGKSIYHELKLDQQVEISLLSVRDARLLVIVITLCSQKEVDLCMEYIRNRHRKRLADNERCWVSI